MGWESFDLKEYIREIILEELDAREVSSRDPVMISLDEARRLMNVGRTSLYLIRKQKAINGFPEVKLSERKTLVDKARLMRWIASQQSVNV